MTSRGLNVKLENHRFSVILIALSLLICGVIAGYYLFVAPPPEKMDLAAIMKVLNLDIYTTENEADIPASAKLTAENVTPNQPLNIPKTDNNTPIAKPPLAEFAHQNIKVIDYRAEFTSSKTSFRTVLPPAKLAPSMFVFSTLPFDAPIAEFPLVLVWQKNLEWTKTRTGDRGGAGAPSPLSPGVIYGKTPPPPVTPPPINPPGPPEPPGPPPAPPPEVSYSGL